MNVNVRFLNPFGKQEPKFWLFNISYYKGNGQYKFRELSIDIINFSFQFTWPWRSNTSEK